MTLDLTNLHPGDELILRDGTVKPFDHYDANGNVYSDPFGGSPNAWHKSSGECYIGLNSGDIVRVRRKSTPANPLIWGASIPGTLPVAAKDEYVPLRNAEVDAFENVSHSTRHAIVLAYHAGWERRRTP